MSIFSLFKSGQATILQKLSLLCGLMCLPILALGFILLSYTQQKIEFIEREQAGVEQLQTIWPLMMAVAAVEKPSDAVSSRMLANFDTTTLKTERVFHISSESATFRQAFQTYLNTSGPDISAARSQVLEKGSALLLRLADKSQLILDPQISSYYTSQILTRQLPSILQNASDVERDFHTLFSGSTVDLERALELNNSLGRMMASKQRLYQAIRYTEPLSATATSQQLSKTLSAFGTQSRSTLMRLIKGQDAYDAVIDDSYAALLPPVQNMWREASYDLQTKLKNRKQQTQTTLWFGYSISGLALILCGVTALLITRSITRPQARLVEAMTTLVAGNTRVVVPYRAYKNEIGVTARAVEHFRCIMAERDTLLFDLEDRVEIRTKELEQAMDAAIAASQAKSTFLAMMSHEIRTPMNGVLGMAEALKRSKMTPAQAEMVETITSSGKVLLNILNDILDLSKVEAGRLTLESIPFSPAETVEAVRELFTDAASGKGLVLSAHIDENAEQFYSGDPTRLRQVLQNLVSNAVKFTAHGHVHIAMTHHPIDDLNDQVTVTVTDTGPGISQDAQDHLFEKFTQADSSITRKFGGTGLGLALCKELVEMMGGVIRVTSAPGKGTSFMVQLTLTKTQPPITAQEPAQTEDAEIGSLRVLIVDDNPTNRLVLKTLFNQMNIEPVLVNDGQQAVDATQTHIFDLILMDVHMPVMDGLTATRIIRQGGGSAAQIPIIALTADVMPEQMAACTAAGMNAHVAKPINPTELMQTIIALLDGSDDTASGESQAQSA